jgi:hypothetical protein
LSDVGRLDAIYEQVIARGVINRSQSRRLDFVGAAVRARSVGANPPAVFRTLVTTNLWDHITDSQEDIARDMIRRHDHRLPAFLATAPRPPSPPPLSHDAEIVGTVRRWLRSEQYQGDFFHAFKRLDEGESWTRDRWDVASQELDAKEH